MNAVIRVKDERLHIAKDALTLFKCREANKEWIVNKGSKSYIKIKEWDEDDFFWKICILYTQYIKKSKLK